MMRNRRGMKVAHLSSEMSCWIHTQEERGGDSFNDRLSGPHRPELQHTYSTAGIITHSVADFGVKFIFYLIFSQFWQNYPVGFECVDECLSLSALLCTLLTFCQIHF